MDFLADPPLGKLAKWLRVMGYNTLYFRRADPNLLMEKAQGEGRVVLTRSIDLRNRLVDARLSHLFIQSDHLPDQLRQVDAAFPLLAAARPFTRCLACNEKLQAVSKEATEGRVPDFVYQTHEAFVECPCCQKIYWPGTHHRRMEEKVRAWLGPTDLGFRI